MASKNCWEFFNCGREPGGENASSLGECSAALEKTLDGFNHGENAGRMCWAVAGTYADTNGEPDCDYLKIIGSCDECEFFKLVRLQEGKEEFVL